MKEKFWVWSWGVFLTLAAFVSGLLSWFTPLPFFYIGRKYSLRMAMMGWLFVLAIVGAAYTCLLGFWATPDTSHMLKLFMWLPGMIYYKSFGSWVVLKSVSLYFSFSISLSLLMVWRSKSEKKVTPFVSQVALGTLLTVSLVFLFCVGPQHFKGFVDLLIKYSQTALDQVIVFNQSAGMSGEELLYIQQNKELIVESFVKLIPGIAISAVFFLVWVNLYIARRIFSVLGFFEARQDLILFRMPFYWVWMIILGLAVFLLNLYVYQSEAIEFVLLNLLIVVSMIYFFQGFAVVAHFFTAKNFSMWIRLVCYFLIIVFIQPLGLMLMGLGFFDSWYDFRKLSAKI